MGKRRKKNRLHSIPPAKLKREEFIDRFCRDCWGRGCTSPSFCYDFFFVRSSDGFEEHSHGKIFASYTYNQVMGYKNEAPVSPDEFISMFCSVCQHKTKKKKEGECSRVHRCISMFLKQIGSQSTAVTTGLATKIGKALSRYTERNRPPAESSIFVGGSEEWINTFKHIQV